MGVMLREGLRRLCAGGRWTYAALWRPAESAGIRHLLWDEGHCEILRDDQQVGDSKSRDDGGLGAVFEKMKAEVHVVGYGLIGSAFLTGNHRWIVRNIAGGQSVGFLEINSQFDSGIQTVAIIPVHPQGVVQLGSIHTIMEDMGFVNRVRSLVSQLGCLAGELIFDNTLSSSLPNDHSGLGQPVREGINRQAIEFPSSKCFQQPSCSSVSESSQSRMFVSGEMPLRSISAVTASSNSIIETHEPKKLPCFSPMISLTGQQHIGFEENCVPSDLCILSNHQLFSQDIKPDKTFMPSPGSSCSFAFLEQLSSTVRSNPTTGRFNRGQSVVRTDSHKHAVGSCSQGLIMLPSSCTRESHEDACESGPLDLDKGGQLMKAVINFEGPGTFSRISCSANYAKDTCTMRESSSTQAIPSISFCTMTADVVGHHIMSGEEVKNSCSTSLVQLSSASQGCAIEVSRLNYGIREQFGGSSSQNSHCFNANKQQSSHSISSVSIMADSSSDMVHVRKSGSDLFDVLGLCDRAVASDGSLDCIFSNGRNADAWESCPDISGCISQLDTNTFDVSVCGTSSEAFTDSRQDQLLDAVISNVSMGTQATPTDGVSRITQSRVFDYPVLHNPSKHGQFPLSGQFQPELFCISPSLLERTLPCSSVKSSCSMAEIGECYSGEGYKTPVNLWSDGDQNAKSDDASFAHFKKADEMGRLNRKRSKPGESPRPRPKDRQMIQDRVKELREIVPNGAKLSIDALLERTIKHMLFLQSVTKHADKLKELGEPKIISKDGGLLLKDNFEGGATWAFEVGSQSMICPIIVEDLNPPRQLLVEMLCEERGFFLEIADLIRGLGLTILKGVMEARSDKVWARFAVEANRDVTRMDIFLSLVQLLEPRAATDAPRQGFDSTSMQTNSSCPQLPPGASKPL